MNRKTLSLLAICTILSPLPAFAAVALDQAIAKYNARDYKGAAAALRALVKTSEEKNPLAHYYLANSYLYTGRRPEALREYFAAYNADTNGPTAKLCKEAIAYLNKSAPKAAASSTAAQTTAATNANLSRVKAAMPPIPQAAQLDPSLEEVQQWSDQQRANYVQAAQSRIAIATQSVADAQALMNSAKSYTSELVPNDRAYGEDEKAFQGRCKTAKAEAHDLLSPYEDYLNDAQRRLSDTKAIYDACVGSYRGLNGWAPVGR